MDRRIEREEPRQGEASSLSPRRPAQGRTFHRGAGPDHYQESDDEGKNERRSAETCISRPFLSLHQTVSGDLGARRTILVGLTTVATARAAGPAAEAVATTCVTSWTLALDQMPITFTSTLWLVRFTIRGIGS